MCATLLLPITDSSLHCTHYQPYAGVRDIVIMLYLNFHVYWPLFYSAYKRWTVGSTPVAIHNLDCVMSGSFLFYLYLAGHTGWYSDLLQDFLFFPFPFLFPSLCSYVTCLAYYSHLLQYPREWIEYYY